MVFCFKKSAKRPLQKSVTLTKNDKFVRKLQKAKMAYQIRYGDELFAICSQIGHFAVVNWLSQRSPKAMIPNYARI
ncbi:hypothetical protein COW94_00115 [Candidatus Peregrinibacteria bacterium CG22_combo_CG10-13_8_21_14_all_44_10]|nr:MAG: hypothetical protein COW94_00115 [Candidatus Peregrinibacteria bacterium CG22_combo_CG10-13_8_21_14_all_44_10]PIX80405.1 MAG: hypothetical protein COZ35_00850 [Candidatus Peregrinibacteria bacterium CG_4_10_14_3_um_filter_44_21]